jgi:hypothetical protein
MPIMRTGRAPVGGSMVGKRAATVSRPATTGSRVGARRFAEGGSPKNPEEGDLNPFGSDEETTRKLNEIYPPKKKSKSPPKKMAKGGKCYAGGGMVGRGDGCSRYKTRAKIV